MVKNFHVMAWPGRDFARAAIAKPWAKVISALFRTEGRNETGQPKLPC